MGSQNIYRTNIYKITIVINKYLFDSGKDLAAAANIVRRHEESMKNTDEVDIDFETMKPSTLRELEFYAEICRTRKMYLRGRSKAPEAQLLPAQLPSRNTRLRIVLPN